MADLEAKVEDEVDAILVNDAPPPLEQIMNAKIQEFKKFKLIHIFLTFFNF